MSPSFVSTSLWQMPFASTRTRTMPGPGVGISRSTISNGPPARETWTARIFGMDPPLGCLVAAAVGNSREGGLRVQRAGGLGVVGCEAVRAGYTPPAFATGSFAFPTFDFRYKGGFMRARDLGRSLFFAVTVLVTGSRLALAQADEIFVTNDGGNSVSVFPRTATGDPPLRVIVGAATGLNRPEKIAIDTVNDELVVANLQANSVTVFSRTANGNIAPLRTIAGALTTLDSPVGVAVDPVNDEIYVVNGPVSGFVTVYPRTANGNVAPLRTFFGFSAPSGMALDLVNNEIAVVNSNPPNAIFFFARTGGAVLRTIAGPSTGLSAPIDVAIDTVNNEVIASNEIGITATVYPRTANGDVAPTRTLSLGFQPLGVVVDPVNNELSLVSLNNLVVTYARTASGSASPLRILGSSTFASTRFAAITLGVGGPTATPTPVGPTATPTPTTTANPTLTPTLAGPTPTPLPGGVVAVPTLDPKGLLALAVVLGLLGYVALRRMSS